MTQFPCAHLGMDVELTDEREAHIATQHPDLLPDPQERIAEVLGDPDQVRRSSRFASTRLLSRWFGDVGGGKHVVVVVVHDAPAAGRAWVVTAYIARRLSGGTLEWTRS